MNRPMRFMVVAVTYIISFVIHRVSLELFRPGQPLYEAATTGTAVLSGPSRAQFWFEVLAVWVPVIAAVGVTAWALVSEYRRQTQTAATRVRR